MKIIKYSFNMITTFVLILLLLLSSCQSSSTLMEVSGIVTYGGDGTALVHPLITRLSDGKSFSGDESGRYSVLAAEGDTLVFSYVGTINDTVMVSGKHLDVVLKPYASVPDEYVVRIESNYPDMETELKTYVADKNARIGIAVVINGKDTVMVNGNKEFPMMSVFKFPLALAVAHTVESNGSSLDEIVTISEDDLKENTYSPMLKKYGRKPMKMKLRELLEWSLKESDNNAADILLKYTGGINGLKNIRKSLYIPEAITVGASEDDMHRDPYLCYLNRSTPLAMAELFDLFKHKKEDTALYREIASMVETCQTGTDRLAAPLNGSDAIIGHKTGTGDSLTPGRISAVNDCGYVILPDGQSYSLAVFVADSEYDMAATSKIIADISAIVYSIFDCVQGKTMLSEDQSSISKPILQHSYSTCPGVSLTIKNSDIGPHCSVDSMVVYIKNDLDKEVMFGEYYTLEKKKDGKWQPIPFNRKYQSGECIQVFTAIGIIYSPHSKGTNVNNTRPYSKKFEKGIYRLSKTFYVDGIESQDTVYVEFEVL